MLAHRKHARTIGRRHATTASFVKFEGYTKPKWARSISAYDDQLQAQVLPFMHAVDDCVFRTGRTRRFFVKAIPVHLRAAYIAELFGPESPVIATDYTSFECVHRAHIAQMGVEWIRHVAEHTDDPAMVLVGQCIKATNICKYRDCDAIINETLMSGSVWTSSLNGVANLLLTSYLALSAADGDPLADDEHVVRERVRRFYDPECFRAVFEGDDGLTAAVACNERAIAELGIKLKFEQHDNYRRASFCGIVCPNRVNLVDPTKCIVDFFKLSIQQSSMRATKQYGLMRAKALSYAHAYASCPIVGALAYAALERTRSVEAARTGDNYARARVADALRWIKQQPSTTRYNQPKVEPADRAEIEFLYGYSIEWQLEFERQIRLWGSGYEHYLPEHPKLDAYYANARERLKPTSARNFLGARIGHWFSPSGHKRPDPNLRAVWHDYKPEPDVADVCLRAAGTNPTPEWEPDPVVYKCGPDGHLPSHAYFELDAEQQLERQRTASLC